jgi:DNA-binding FadR family transcriptional regulator
MKIFLVQNSGINRKNQENYLDKDLNAVKIKLEGLAGELAVVRIEPDQLSELDGLIKEAARSDQKGENGRHNGLIE